MNSSYCHNSSYYQQTDIGSGKAEAKIRRGSGEKERRRERIHGEGEAEERGHGKGEAGRSDHGEKERRGEAGRGGERRRERIHGEGEAEERGHGKGEAEGRDHGKKERRGEGGERRDTARERRRGETTGRKRGEAGDREEIGSERLMKPYKAKTVAKPLHIATTLRANKWIPLQSRCKLQCNCEDSLSYHCKTVAHLRALCEILCFFLHFARNSPHRLWCHLPQFQHQTHLLPKQTLLWNHQQ
ncbi:hypothetical protein YC2023_014903 [Brassica napus]